MARTRRCFAADTINRYVRQTTENGETARAAVLYRTNSQSRLFEEALRRYQLKYHVVGGFSFYERAEIKDLISYLKVIQNPDDFGFAAASDQYAGARDWQDDDRDESNGSHLRPDCRCGARWVKQSIGN